MKDDMVTTQGSAFTGIAEVLLQLAQQICGALNIPLVRLLGQSPGGLNSSGDSELKQYYRGIAQRQKYILVMVTIIYRCIAQSLRIDVGEGFSVAFKPLWQMEETEKADVASKDTQTVLDVHSTGVISDQVFLRELQHIGKRTGRWKSITDEDVESASDEIAPKGEEVVEPPPSPDDFQKSDSDANGAANQKAN
jgi:phage-related protein (TIGR01555 family)